jgi:signal transduction histidine kinase
LKQDDRYGELKETARKQRELLHFISHEVKGHLTKSKAAFAGIVEGDYGPVSSPLTSVAQQALADTQKGVETVMSVLENSDFQKGTSDIEKKPFDFSQTVKRSMGNFRATAAQRNLELYGTIEDFCAMVGDERKLEQHVIRNLLDNALRYTHAGQIAVALKKTGKNALLTVTDTGVGIAPEDMQKLFTEGGHGEHSREINPESTGYGLFIAKQIVQAHGGRIWAESRGAGMGSTFFVELPLK